MADPRDARDGTSIGSPDAAAITPRWVKVFGVIALVVAVLFIVLMFAGGGRHGPRRHMPSSDAQPVPPSGQR